MFPRSDDDGPKQVARLVKGSIKWSATLSGRTVQVSWRDGNSRVDGEPRRYDDENQALREWKKAIADARAKGFAVEGEAPPSPQADHDELVRQVSGAGGIRALHPRGHELVLACSELTAQRFPDALKQAVQSPALRSIDTLTVELDWPHDADAVVDALAPLALPPTLRGLVLCRFDDREKNRREFVGAALDARPLADHFRELHQLVLQAGWLTLPPLRAPGLKQLRLRVAGLSRAALFALGAAELPALETLELWLGSPEHGAECTAADLIGVLNEMRWPRLTRRRLHAVPFSDALIAPLLDLAWLPQLESLDLGYGTLTDAGAEALCAHADRLQELGVFVECNELTRPMAQRLADAGINAVWQRPPGSRRGVERYLPLGALDADLEAGDELDVSAVPETE